MRDLPDRPIGLLLEPRKPARPVDERWCKECDGEHWHGHEPHCPLVEDAKEFAAALAVDATIAALSKTEKEGLNEH